MLASQRTVYSYYDGSPVIHPCTLLPQTMNTLHRLWNHALWYTITDTYIMYLSGVGSSCGGARPSQLQGEGEGGAVPTQLPPPPPPPVPTPLYVPRCSEGTISICKFTLEPHTSTNHHMM